jgi:hypothetical protein
MCLGKLPFASCAREVTRRRRPPIIRRKQKRRHRVCSDPDSFGLQEFQRSCVAVSGQEEKVVGSTRIAGRKVNFNPSTGSSTLLTGTDGRPPFRLNKVHSEFTFLCSV